MRRALRVTFLPIICIIMRHADDPNGGARRLGLLGRRAGAPAGGASVVRGDVPGGRELGRLGAGSRASASVPDGHGRALAARSGRDRRRDGSGLQRPAERRRARRWSRHRWRPVPPSSTSRAIYRLPADDYPGLVRLRAPVAGVVGQGRLRAAGAVRRPAARREARREPRVFRDAGDPRLRAPAGRGPDRVEHDPRRRQDGGLGGGSSALRGDVVRLDGGVDPALPRAGASAHPRDGAGARAGDRPDAARALRAPPGAGGPRGGDDVLRRAGGGRHDRGAHRGPRRRVRGPRVRPGPRAGRHGRREAHAWHERRSSCRPSPILGRAPP